ncbi:MAG: ribonuclease P protein component [Solirubrobacterales bacterium]
MAERRKRGRLSRSGDFDRVYRDGHSHANRFLVMYSFPRPDSPDQGTRLGVSVSRKVGGATERNKVKRALREAFWSLDPALPADHDFVLVARPDVAGLVERSGTAGVAEALRELAAESGLEAA